MVQERDPEDHPGLHQLPPRPGRWRRSGSLLHRSAAAPGCLIRELFSYEINNGGGECQNLLPLLPIERFIRGSSTAGEATVIAHMREGYGAPGVVPARALQDGGTLFSPESKDWIISGASNSAGEMRGMP